MNRISRDSMLIQVAQIVAKRATCGRRQVGAVIAREGRILVTGYNGPPPNAAHCDPTICDLSRACTRSTHAEANAIAFAAREGIRLEDSTLYLTLTPCLSCSQLVVASGISRVICLEPYRDEAGLLWLTRHGVSFTYASDLELL